MSTGMDTGCERVNKIHYCVIPKTFNSGLHRSKKIYPVPILPSFIVINVGDLNQSRDTQSNLLHDIQLLILKYYDNQTLKCIPMVYH